MAGIMAILKKKKINEELQTKIREFATRLEHRGNKHRFIYDKFPLEIIFYQKKEIKTDKPLSFSVSEDNKKIIALDGSIYNLDEINDKFLKLDYIQKYDNLNLEGLLAGYTKKGKGILSEIIGSFSGVIYDGEELIGFKDPVGAKPLYYCSHPDFFIFSSELKALTPLQLNVKSVKPGHIVTSNNRKESYFQYPKYTKELPLTPSKIKILIAELNQRVKTAVADNIKEGEKVNALLSGGLDSTIITHIAKDLVDDLNVYTAGIEGSKDLFYAQKYAKINNLNHTVVRFTIDDMLDCLTDVIYALETFDAALIRSSVPMFLISKKVKSEQGSCVLLTGEGADELFGGYNYLLNYNSTKALNQELLNLLEIEHITGLQRVDRIPYYFSIEARAPLFDRRLVEFSFKIPPELKLYRKKGVGVAKKWILRKAFENEMPSEFIWRKKQKFSEGAGSQFILRDYLEKQITDEEFQNEKEISSDFSLRSKEELYYWRIFNSQFEPTLETISKIGITSVYEV